MSADKPAISEQSRRELRRCIDYLAGEGRDRDGAIRGLNDWFLNHLIEEGLLEWRKIGMPRARQQYLSEEMKPVEIPEIVTAAEEYQDVSECRKEFNKRETSAQSKLLELMKTHKLKRYNLGGGQAVVVSPSKEKVRLVTETPKNGIRRKRKEKAESGTPDSARISGPLEHDSQDEFVRVVVGEVIESHNQSVDWWKALSDDRRRELFDKRMAKRPKR